MLSTSKRIGAVVGCAAVALMGALCIAANDSAAHRAGIEAGSGRGAGGGIYTQPTVGGMETGATQTWSGLAATTPEFPKARPPL
jgi:hypothetical protein